MCKWVYKKNQNRTDTHCRLLSPLKCLQQTESLFDRAPDRIVVDLDAAHDAFRIDDEQAAKSSTKHVVRLVGYEHVVRFACTPLDKQTERIMTYQPHDVLTAGDLLGCVCHQGDIQTAYTSIFTSGSYPSQLHAH